MLPGEGASILSTRPAMPDSGAAVPLALLHVRFGDATPELQAQAAALQRCASQPAYSKGFENFFGAVSRLLRSGAPVPLAEWRGEVVRTLLPMAPYLLGL